MTIRILVSACLLGQPVRYDGRSNEQKVQEFHNILQQWQQTGWLIPVCPETAGGLPTPRPAAEIIAADGTQVLAGKAQVKSADGRDFTAAFIAGAEKTLQQAQQCNASIALLAARSPSCGSQGIYDGTFNGRLRDGMGVTTALLEQHGIRCFSPDNFADLQALVKSLAGTKGA